MLTLRTLTWTALVIILGACEREIAVDIKREPPRLAVYSLMHPDSLMTVWVSRAKSVLDTTRVRAVASAEVVLSADPGSVQVLTLVNAAQGKYQATVLPQPGAVYHLSVTAEGYPRAEATTQVPWPVGIQEADYAVVPIDKATACLLQENCADTTTHYAVAFTFQDPPAERNYYQVSSTLSYYGERYVYNSLTEEYEVVWDTLTTSTSNYSTDPAVDDIGNLIDKLRYETYSDYYFTDALFDGQRYTFDFSTEINQAMPLKMIITLKTFHPEAYNYQQTSRQQQYYDALFYEPVPLAQNIRNGYGIFSSFSQDSVVIALDE